LVTTKLHFASFFEIFMLFTVWSKRQPIRTWVLIKSFV